MNIASILITLFLAKYIKIKHFKHITILLGITLFLKLNIKKTYFLLLIAFIEGCLTKIYETFSLKNLYESGNNSIDSYLLTEEIIFLMTKSTIIIICLLFSINLKTILYINIIGIILSGFFIE